MSKAGPDFFRQKKEWSKRKDPLLTDYLPPYLQKVSRNPGYPICVVDGFAGPGKFDDGESGSPLLIAAIIEKAALGSGVTAIFVEKDPDLAAKLSKNMEPYKFVSVRTGKFLDHLPDIEKFATGKTLFLYLDPFTVEGLEWGSLDRLFSLLAKRQSVELLVNFNAASFARRGLSALKQAVPAPVEGEEDVEELDPIETTPTLEHLDEIVGGDWWKSILLDGAKDFPRKVAAIRDGFCAKLRQRFREVCVHDVKADWKHKIPKYSLIFGSRTPVALLLMNDAMVKSREMYAASTKNKTEGMLFENRTTDVIPDDAELRKTLLKEASEWITREDLKFAVARQHIGNWSTSRMKHEVKELLKSKILESESKKVAINDDIRVRKTR